MKIAFLLPTTDLGRDGIADYTARLGGYCKKAGHEVRLIPLGRGNWMTGYGSIRRSADAAMEAIGEFRPDIISWQFDGRIFHPLCIFPWTLIPCFHRDSAKIHLMAHETWEGDEVNARLRRKAKGILQRHVFSKSLQRIAPDVVHVSNPLYQLHLKKAGFRAGILPLFTSVPLTPSEIPRTDYDVDTWHIVFFGAFRLPWDPQPLMDRIRKIQGRSIMIHHIGRNPQAEVLRVLEDSCTGSLKFIRHGEQTPEAVSTLLMRCHFAATTYDYLHLRKSSVYATFRDHGLPVILTRPGEKTEGEGRLICVEELPEGLEKFGRGPVADSLESIGDQFLNDLGMHEFGGIFTKRHSGR